MNSAQATIRGRMIGGRSAWAWAESRVEDIVIAK
jgi:hypothetical protein